MLAGPDDKLVKLKAWPMLHVAGFQPGGMDMNSSGVMIWNLNCSRM